MIEKKIRTNRCLFGSFRFDEASRLELAALYHPSALSAGRGINRKIQNLHLNKNKAVGLMPNGFIWSE